MSSMSEEERRSFNEAHLAEAAQLIRPEWDRAFLDRLAGSDAQWVEAFDQADIAPAGIGGNEVRTWLAAWAAGRQPLATIGYEVVSSWITGMGVAASSWAAK
jgi:2,3-dihydroxyphenylpropionate 1,2-dioxygenase